MKERPILFSAPMVRALLTGAKTQTRRAVKGMALEWLEPDGFTAEFVADPGNHFCPYGFPGDRLWVREAWRMGSKWDATKPSTIPPQSSTVLYEAGGYASNDTDGWNTKGGALVMPDWAGRLRAGMFMPRWASRITLEITEVRVERLLNISDEDAIAEGIEQVDELYGARLWKLYGFELENTVMPRRSYCALWDTINGKDASNANPWVWCVSFRLVA